MLKFAIPPHYECRKTKNKKQKHDIRPQFECRNRFPNIKKRYSAQCGSRMLKFDIPRQFLFRKAKKEKRKKKTKKKKKKNEKQTNFTIL